MNSKQIRNKIERKFESWLKSIDDDELVEKLRKHTIITGGCIVSMLLNEDVNDYDIYFETDVIAREVAEYYVGKVDDKTRKEIFDIKVIDEDRLILLNTDMGCYKVEKVDGKYAPVFFTDNAITLKDGIQLIIRFTGDPTTIHSNYDYVHATSYWHSADGKLVLHPEALESILTKELRYVGSKYPVSSIIRMRKFIARGWFINAGQVLKIAMQISDLNLRDSAVLRDQLIGVDMMYFSEFLTRYKDKLDTWDYDHLSNEIDRVFDEEGLIGVEDE